MLKESIDEERKAQSERSELKAQLKKAKAAADFMQCAEIQKKIEELKVCSCFHQFPSTPFLSYMFPSLSLRTGRRRSQHRRERDPPT